MTFRLHRYLIFPTITILVLTTVLLDGPIGSSVAALVFGILVTLLVGHFVRTRISEPLQELSSAIQKVSEGESGSVLPVRGTREIAALLRDTNAMTRNLNARELELKERARRAESSLLAIGEGILILGSNGHVILSNSAMNRLLATDRSLVGRTTLDLFRNPSLEASIQQAFKGGTSAPVDLELGSASLARARATGVPDLTGETDFVIVVFHDQTEADRIETMRRDFVANVSHEFKTPLTVIRGYTETLLSGALKDKQAAPEFLKIVERNARHLESLVGDLLTLGKLEAELPVFMEEVRPKALVDELIALKRTVIGSRGIRVTNECADLSLQADRARLATAVSNLLDNAITYNRPAGEINITGKAENGSFVLSIADSGEGIPAADLQRIFERFYRVDRSRARESGGTGLGLAIVRHAIESQGGTISVTSKLGTGSTFSIRLPAHTASAKAH